jgi:hypothetical protein
VKRPAPQRMTTRRRLNGWFTFLRVALIVVGALAYGWPDYGYNHSLRVVALVILLALVCGLFAFAFRCPRCRTSLVPRASTILMRGAPFACPKCGGNIDEAMQD